MPDPAGVCQGRTDRVAGGDVAHPCRLVLDQEDTPPVGTEDGLDAVSGGEPDLYELGAAPQYGSQANAVSFLAGWVARIAAEGLAVPDERPDRVAGVDRVRATGHVTRDEEPMVLGTCLALGLERRQRDVARPGRFLVGLTLPYGEPGGLVTRRAIRTAATIEPAVARTINPKSVAMSAAASLLRLPNGGRARSG